MRPWRSGGGRMGRQSHHGGRGELAHGWGDGGWMLGMGRARVAGVCFFFVSRRPPVYVGGGGPPSGCVRASLPFQYALVGEPPVEGAVDGVLVLVKRAAPLAGFGLSGDVVAPAFVLFCKPPSAGFHASGSPQGPQLAGCRWTAGSSQLAARVLAGPHPSPGDRHLSAPPSCASNRVSVPAGAAVASPVGVISAAAGLRRSVIMHPTGAVPADAYAIARPVLLEEHEVSQARGLGINRVELSGSLY